MTLFVFGNEYLSEDAMAVRVAQRLGVPYTHCRSPEELLEGDGDITILDVVDGITSPVRFTGSERVRARSLTSLHDFDVGYFLGLLRALGEEPAVTVIGVPATGDPEAYAREVAAWI